MQNSAKTRISASMYRSSAEPGGAWYDSTILDPRSTWADGEEYDQTAQKLVQLFVDNFAEFEAHVDAGVRDAAPTAA